MNSAQFRDPVYHMCLAGAVTTLWSLTLEVVGLSHCNDFCHFFWNIFVNFVPEFTEFSENI